MVVAEVMFDHEVSQAQRQYKHAKQKKYHVSNWAEYNEGCLGAQLAISVHNCPVLADTRFPMSIFKRTQRKYVKKPIA